MVLYIASSSFAFGPDAFVLRRAAKVADTNALGEVMLMALVLE